MKFEMKKLFSIMCLFLFNLCFNTMYNEIIDNIAAKIFFVIIVEYFSIYFSFTKHDIQTFHINV
jgi:hypothetical protein